MVDITGERSSLGLRCVDGWSCVSAIRLSLTMRAGGKSMDGVVLSTVCISTIAVCTDDLRSGVESADEVTPPVCVCRYRCESGQITIACGPGGRSVSGSPVKRHCSW